MLAYCGRSIKELPKDGVTIFASVISKPSKTRLPKIDANSPEQKTKLQEALKLFHQHMKNPRILLREKIRNVIEGNLLKRYEKYPVICENDPDGARLAENMGKYMYSSQHKNENIKVLLPFLLKVNDRWYCDYG